MNVWVVEMWNEARRRWEPCAECALFKADSRWRLTEWRRKNPSDRFRVVRYERSEPKERT